MPKLRDLYGMDLNRLGGYRPEYTSVMERPLTDVELEQRAAPIDRPYASGQLEARRDMDDLQRRRRYPLDEIPNLKLSDLWSE